MQPEDKKQDVETKDTTPVQQNQELKIETTEDTPEQINWRKFREARAKDRKEKEEAMRRAEQKEAEAAALKAAMEALVSKPTPSHETQIELSEEDRLQKIIDDRLAERDRQYEEQRRQREQAELPQRLASTYQDFNQVCSTENLDYLEYHYPEVASAFKHMPDGFDKWSSVYKAVKRFIPNAESKKEQVKAEKNFNKPQSMSRPGATQTGDSAPMYLDDARRAANWARMQKVMKSG